MKNPPTPRERSQWLQGVLETLTRAVTVDSGLERRQLFFQSRATI